MKIKGVLILILLFGFIFGGYFLYQIYTSVNTESKSVYFTISQGEGVNQISDNLYNQRLIKNKFIFRTYVWLKDKERSFIAGEHKLDVNMNIVEITRVLTTAISVNKEKKITIIEGWTAQEIGEYLEQQNLVKKQEFLESIKLSDWQDDYDFLAGVTRSNIEGFLFPDTYRVFTDASAEDIIKKMLGNFDQKLTSQMRQDIASQGKNLYEVIIMASIIEREAQTAEDMKKVSGVFWKRINAGMGLQSDATINYITGKRALRPTFADLAIDSPYNTYKYRGLTPGPIANPGINAIKAAIYPDDNPYYYFLMDPQGKTHYAETYEGHQRNIANYLE